MMVDRPILFSAPMVRALLAGRKTQTRRHLRKARVFATPESPAFTLKGDDLARALQGADRFRHLADDGWFWESDAFDYQAPATRTGWMAHIGYAPGDRLWVKETWRSTERFDDCAPSKIPNGYMPVSYEASPLTTRPMGRVRQSIFMPRWASRLTLTVTDVRVERLQDITEQDASAEGVDLVYRQLAAALDPRGAYASLWDGLHDHDGERWADNPWLVALTFTVERRNIDG